jgi:hypothetical protein
MLFVDSYLLNSISEKEKKKWKKKKKKNYSKKTEDEVGRRTDYIDRVEDNLFLAIIIYSKKYKKY